MLLDNLYCLKVEKKCLIFSNFLTPIIYSSSIFKNYNNKINELNFFNENLFKRKNNYCNQKFKASEKKICSFFFGKVNDKSNLIAAQTLSVQILHKRRNSIT